MIPAAKGDKLTDFITSQWYNDVSKTASMLGVLTGSSKVENPIKIKCLSYSEIQRFYPASLEAPLLSASAPSGTLSIQHNTTGCFVTDLLINQWGIVQGPVSPTIASEIVMQGITWAYVEIRDLAHGYITRDQNDLVSGYSGIAKIIKRPTGTPPYNTYALININATPAIEIYKFTLKEDMTPTYALGDLSRLDGTALPITAVITNTLQHFTHLKDGDEGLCVLDDGAYYAIHPETSAETISATFELTANLARTLGVTATAEIIETTDPDLSIGDPITVVNSGEFKSYTGCKGMAVKLNTGDWWIVHVDQHAILWQAVLSADTHDFSLGGGNVPGAVSAQDTITYSSKFAYTDYPFSYLPADPITIDNPSNFIGKSGDTILIAFDPNTDDNNIVAVFPAQSRRFMFELTADRGTGLTGNTAAAGYQALGTGGGDIPTSFNVADTFYLAHNAKDGDQGICEWDYNLEAWHVVAIKHTATLVKGTLNGSFSATPSTFSVTVVAGLNGVSPSSPITVQNRFSWEAGTTGHNILVGWDNIAGEWYPIQMRCPT